MPYLKIKVANNGKSDDWVTVSNLNLNTLSVSGDTTIGGNATINGSATIKGDTTIDGNMAIKGNTTIGDDTTIGDNTNADTLTIKANVKEFISVGKDENDQTQSVEISDGELKIQSPGNTTRQSLIDYLNLNTSGCTVGNSSEPGSYTSWSRDPKKGDLYIQLKTVGEGSAATTYSLLWYRDDTGWKHVHAIWG